MFIFISMSLRASRFSLKFITSKLILDYKINVYLVTFSFHFLPCFSNKRIDSSILGTSLKPHQTGVFKENVTFVLRTFKVIMLMIIKPHVPQIIVLNKCTDI